jgi:5-methylcytosine-specific restriction protein A
VPLSASSESVTTTLDDLAVLCSNCHRIIHRSTPMLSVAELSKVVSRGRP